MGKWGNMFHTFLFGPKARSSPLAFRQHPNAEYMYHRATTFPTPIGIIHTATARWKASKSPSQHFFGHSYTMPTPKEYTLQQLGHVITNALALHIRDAKRGQLKPAPTRPPGLTPDFNTLPSPFDGIAATLTSTDRHPTPLLGRQLDSLPDDVNLTVGHCIHVNSP
jgi:hypothetical protein